MNKTTKLKLSDYDYNLPKELIAQKPADKRENSRLLVMKLKNKKLEKIEHEHFKDIVKYFKKGDVLVINQTKVYKARIHARKETGGKIELIISASKRTKDIFEKNMCSCIIKGKVKEGTKIIISDNAYCEVIKKEENISTVKFNKSINYITSRFGIMPTPPYIKRKLDDDNRYQTVYAKNTGSVAAPTAGFHFTKELLDKIKAKGVNIAKITLHVSFGTFLPIKSENPLEHNMDEEYYEVPKEASEIINNRTGRLFAVGTTSLKTLETVADKNKKISSGCGWSKLFLTPAYTFKSGTDCLITNFHLPKSTLILLASGFAGRDNIMKAYNEAIKKKYRFYSFGDSMLILCD